MITIKAFSTLCGCNTQTLRYYDRIGLLKPIKVDPCSGYRYYHQAQAIDFVKIKNLQAADFTIDEIKNLLTMPDQQVYEAFDHKISQQQQKLERIKEIRQSYLTEKNNMERLVQNVADYILHAVSDYEVLREFGLSPEDGPAVVTRLKDYIEQSTMQHLPAEPDIHLLVNNRVIRGTKHIADAFESLKESGYNDTVLLGDAKVCDDEGIMPENSKTIWACHGWSFVHEFIDDIPPMKTGIHYCFLFKLTEDKYKERLEFPLFMIAAMLPRIESDEIIMGCIVERSPDAYNHFALMQRS